MGPSGVLRLHSPHPIRGPRPPTRHKERNRGVTAADDQRSLRCRNSERPKAAHAAISVVLLFATLKHEVLELSGCNDICLSSVVCNVLSVVCNSAWPTMGCTRGE